MKLLLNPILLFFSCITTSYASSSTGNTLRNPSFENVTVNGTSRFSLLNRTNSNIPGWSFGGTVYYVASGDNLSFPDNGGHAIQLAENGRINQTLRIKDTDDSLLDYVVSFNLAMPSDDCADYYNRTAVLNVTVHQTSVFHGSKNVHYERSSVFFYHGRNISRRSWETNAFSLGQLGNVDYVNIEIKSVKSTMTNITRDRNVSSNCWPLVDAFTVERNRMRMWMNENLLSNGDFEVGPSFLNNSFEGVLLNPQQESFYSPLQDWSILGTIRYIDSKHYKVPRGKAAVELLSGDPSGIQFSLILTPTLTLYTLNFTMGDANDSCVGEFILYLQIGQDVHNFTMSSYGRGSSSRRSITFKAEPSSTFISETFMITFYIFNETRTSDGVLCGPVLDNIVLVGSYVERVIMKVFNGVLVISLFLAYLVIY